MPFDFEPILGITLAQIRRGVKYRRSAKIEPSFGLSYQYTKALISIMVY